MSEGFSEQTLRQAIVNTWGAAGAHIDVYDHLLVENSRLQAKLDAVGEVIAAAKAFDEAWRKGPREPGAVDEMFAARLAMRESIAALDEEET